MEYQSADYPASRIEELLPAPPTTARPLPNGRGFLRVAPSGGGLGSTPAPSQPAPQPTGTPPAIVGVGDAAGQLDLFSWGPPVQKGEQLLLFNG